MPANTRGVNRFLVSEYHCSGINRRASGVHRAAVYTSRERETVKLAGAAKFTEVWQPDDDSENA